MSSESFSNLVVKSFVHWDLMVHENQEYLGRCVIWCRRENAVDLVETTVEEREELFEIIKLCKSTLSKVFQPDLFNYAFLSNKTRHLHCHVVPRYASAREFSGMIFTDKLWGKNYLTNPDFHTPLEILEQVKIKLKENP